MGAAAAVVIVAAAWQVSLLSTAGAGAAVVIALATVAAGWSWAGLVVLFFASSVALTQLGASAKAARTRQVVAKGGARDASQVAANGGIFALAALLWVGSGWDGWTAFGAGAIAAAASDTWATEVGTLAGGVPRSIVSRKRVAPGTSGGVSAPGLLAAVAGAAFMAIGALALGWPRGIAAAALAGGVAGSTIDSLLGATVQVRRWCDACEAPTERTTHGCGTSTRVVGGTGWIDNDVVNALSTAAGGLLALLVAA